ncbi:MAG TPA: hypothetical protein VJM80_12760 [bacterium]|nr:hypothetical protein [bacterium]
MIGEINFLVEGITDQILIVNVSSFFESFGRPHVDLSRVSIIPYGEEPALRHLVAMARARSTQIVVLSDRDSQGEKVRLYCGRESIPLLKVEDYTDRWEADSSIEDVIGTDEYIRFINDFYAGFTWFTPLDAGAKRAAMGNRSLGSHVESLFKTQFGEDFSKTGVSVFIADNLSRLSSQALGRFEGLFESFQSLIVP